MCMSKKVVNNKILYSLEEVSYEFISHDRSKKTMYDFVDVMVRLHLINRTTVRYNNQPRYYYSISDWFKELIEGHYYTKNIIRNGKSVNGTLYFDFYASILMERVYLYYKAGKIKTDNVLENVYKIIAYTAPEFINGIFDTDEPEFIENIDYTEKLVKSIQKNTDKEIEEKKVLTKDQYKEICDKCFDGWYFDEDCINTCNEIDKYFGINKEDDYE